MRRGSRHGPRLFQKYTRGLSESSNKITGLIEYGIRSHTSILSSQGSLTPWQTIVGTLTGIYALRNIHALLGFSSPEPHARLYSRDFYRATWLVTAMDAGFATAMTVKPKWVRDIASCVFSICRCFPVLLVGGLQIFSYSAHQSSDYVFYANEAEDKVCLRVFC